MKFLKKSFQLILFLFVVMFSFASINSAATQLSQNHLNDFIKKYSEFTFEHQDSYTYSLAESFHLSRVTGLWDIHKLKVSSSQWSADHQLNKDWVNEVIIVMPRLANNENNENKALLFVDGGSNNHSINFSSEDFKQQQLGYGFISFLTQAPVIIVRQVPNQPLVFTNHPHPLSEDDAISFTFKRFLDTADPTWPLLFPMVNSVVHSMNAVQSFLDNKYDSKKTPDEFILTGASKRGWTTWLTATIDDRVKAIAPAVFDMLNFKLQLKDQKIFYSGTTSTMLNPYKKNGVIEQMLNDSIGEQLIELVDPFSYKSLLDLPKLVILTTGDDFWTLTAANHYRDQLPGETLVYYKENCDHSCTGESNGDIELFTLNAEYLYRFNNNLPMPYAPKVIQVQNKNIKIQLVEKQPVEKLVLWYAHAKTKDFRNSTIGKTWKSIEVSRKTHAHTWQGVVPSKPGYYTGFYVNAYYKSALYYDNPINRILLDRTSFTEHTQQFHLSSKMHLINSK